MYLAADCFMCIDVTESSSTQTVVSHSELDGRAFVA